VNLINNALNAGTSVTVTTGAGGAQPGNVTFANNAAVAKTGGGNASFTVNAANNITFGTNANITSTAGQLNVNLNAAAGGISNLRAVNTLGGVLTLNAGGNITQAGVISGTGSVVKQGGGTLTLSQANTYTGATVINQGTLQLSNNNRIADASAVTVAAGATFNLANRTETVGSIAGAGNITLGTGTLTSGGNNSTTTFSGVISGTGGVTKAGTGTLILSGNNTYTGATTVNGNGTLSAASATALGAGAGATTVASGSTLNVNGVTIAENVTLNGTGVGGNGALTGTGTAAVSGNVALASASTIGVAAGGDTLTLSGVLSGANALTKAGAGTLVLSGAANTYTGATNVNAGTLRVGSALNELPNGGAVTVAAGATLDLNGFSETVGSIAGAGNITLGAATLTSGGSNASTTFSGVVSGAGGLTKAGTGTLTLSGANTYNGATNVNAGTLSAANASALGSTAGGTTVASGAALNINNVAIGAETVTLSGAGVGATGALTGTGTASLSGNVALNAATTVGVAAAAGKLTLSGVVSGANALTKVGAGTLVLSGNNTYTGLTTVSAGTLSAANANALGTTAGATTVAANATLDVNGVTIAENVSITGNGVGGNGALTGTGTAAVNGTVTLTGNSRVGAATAGDTLTLNGAVGQTGANRTLDKRGAGTVVLAGANTYSGATTVTAGTLVAANAAALGTTGAGTTVTNGATLQIANVAIGAEAVTLNGTGVGGNGALTSTGNASLSGNVALASASTVGVAAGADTLTLSGVVSGANALTKVGAGTLVLSGAGNNTYTGATNVNGGTLVAAKAAALGTTAGGTTVANGATLQIANVAIGAEAVTLNGAGVGGNGALTGTGTASLTGNVVLNTASTVGAPLAGDTLTLSGVISGANALTKAGAGVVALSGAGANTYTDATNVNAGTLRVGSASNKLPDAGAVTVAGGATLDLNSFNETVGSIAGAGNITLGSATLTSGGNNASTAFSGAISGTGGLTKLGTGTLTLSGNNSYSGATTISAGTLTAANSNALGTTAGGTTVANGATLNIAGVGIGAEAVTINGNGVGGSGALVGTGSASLGGALTVATASRIGVAGGSLALNGAVAGPGALDLAGAGTLTFGAAVGGVTPLASLTSANTLAVNVNGALVRSTGAQTYNGSLTTGGATTLQTAGGIVNAVGPVSATAGTLTLDTGAGNVSMINPANDFSSVTVTSAGGVSLFDANAMTVGPVSAAGNVLVQTAAGAGNDLTLAGNVASSGGDVTLASGEDINYGAFSLSAGGRWLTYSRSPAQNSGTIPAPGNAKPNIYNCSFGGPCGATVPATGNHNVYSYQPTLNYVADPASRSYGEPNPAFTGSVTGLVNGDTAADAYSGTATFLSPATSASNVGSYAIDGSGLTSDIGYAFAQASGNATALTITARPITVTADPGQTKIYGEADPLPFTYSVTGGPGTTGSPIVAGDSLTGALDRVPGENVGAYAIQQGTLAASPAANYALSYVGDTFAITARPITVTADPGQTKIYGEADPLPFTYSVVGGPGTTGSAIVSGDSLTGALGRVAGENVGNYAITQGTLAASPAANYALSYVGDTFAITVRPITVTANPGQTKIYGAADPLPYTYTVVGGPGTTGNPIVAGDSLTGALDRVAGENVGGYAIQQGTLAASPAANYLLTFVPASFVITPATLTYVADAVKTFIGLPLPSFTGTVSGFQAGDTLASATTGTLLFATTATNTLVPGVYPVFGSGLAANNGNYVFVQAPGNATAFTVAGVAQNPSRDAAQAQRITRCEGEFAYADPIGSLPCSLSPDATPAERVAAGTRWLGVDGAGIRLPPGVR
jgi:autotransporter-associated beta strand protein